MTAWRLVVRSLLFHWRLHTAVALGVAAATAVLTGALLVGDSVRGSLRGLVLDRLGKIDALLVSEHFFRSELAAQLAADPSFSSRYDQAIPAILFPQGTVEYSASDRTSRASRVLVVAAPSAFWDLDTAGIRPRAMPAEDEVILNQPLASELGAKLGETVTLRLPEAENAIPAESPLGEKEDRVRGIPGLKVVAILPAEGLGRFSLNPSQSQPRIAFTGLATVQTRLRLDGQVNALLVSASDGQPPPDAEACRELNGLLHPGLEDYGLSLGRIQLQFGAQAGSAATEILDYFSFTSDRMMIGDEVAAVAENAFAGHRAQGVLTYLANALVPLDSEGREDPAGGIPYSTVVGVDSQAGIGPLVDGDEQPLEPLGNDDIVINSWVADDQGLRVGSRLRVYYYRPETTDRHPAEVYRDFTVKAIAPLTAPSKPFSGNQAAVYDQRPTLANDKDLTPQVRGVTDQESIENWETPFELKREVRDQDERYYDAHRLTPKAFVSLATAQNLWGSRFGGHTSWRIPTPPELTDLDSQPFKSRLESAFLQQAQQSRAKLGLEFVPIKAQGLRAASGTTPFDVLFLALSSFLIAAALMLVSLLFRLGVEQRADQLGLLLAVGLRRQRTSRLLVLEGLVVAAVGALLGVALGVAYAWLMLAGLRTVWLGAIVTPFLVFHASATSLLVGYALGILVSALTIAHAVRRLRQIPARRLLAGQASPEGHAGRPSRPWGQQLGWGLLVAALGLSVAATQLGGEAQAGAFVSGGAAVLVGLLLLIRHRLAHVSNSASAPTMSLFGLAVSSARRNPGRSSLTIGLIASASFLITAMSSFRLDPSLQGAGGFEWVAESSLPIFADLTSPSGVEELLGEAGSELASNVILPLRVRPGDDASCNNLYSAQSPRVLGVPPSLSEYFDQAETGFAWGATLAETEVDQANPWRLLARPPQDGAIPVVIDQNTAMFSLGIYAPGTRASFEYDGVEIEVFVVGFLKNSILQGNILMAQSHFQSLFPEIAGYRYFLIKSGAGQNAAIGPLLEDALSDQGFDVRNSRELLAALLAVQNTYLSTFQSLGALGLLLGTFGLATVQLRSVLERRAELALLRASGFQHRRVGRLVLWENLFLLLGGLSTGVVAAVYAVLPHIVLGEAAISMGGFGRDLAIMLGLVVAAGILTGLIAVRWTVEAPLIPALRGD